MRFGLNYRAIIGLVSCRGYVSVLQHSKLRHSPLAKRPKFSPPLRKWMDLDFNQPLTTSLAAIRTELGNARAVPQRVYTLCAEVSTNQTGNYTDELRARAAFRWFWMQKVSRETRKLADIGSRRGTFLAENFCQLTAGSSLPGMECRRGFHGFSRYFHSNFVTRSKNYFFSLSKNWNVIRIIRFKLDICRILWVHWKRSFWYLWLI